MGSLSLSGLSEGRLAALPDRVAGSPGDREGPGRDGLGPATLSGNGHRQADSTDPAGRFRKHRSDPDEALIF